MASVVALERVELSDSDDDFQYAEVEVPSDDDDDEPSDDPLASLKAPLRKSGPLGGAGGPTARATLASAGSTHTGAASVGHGGSRSRPGAPETVTDPVPVDDFVRNFLLNAGLHRALDAFNTEWCVMVVSAPVAGGRWGAAP